MQISLLISAMISSVILSDANAVMCVHGGSNDREIPISSAAATIEAAAAAAAAAAAKAAARNQSAATSTVLSFRSSKYATVKRGLKRESLFFGYRTLIFSPGQEIVVGVAPRTNILELDKVAGMDEENDDLLESRGKR